MGDQFYFSRDFSVDQFGTWSLNHFDELGETQFYELNPFLLEFLKVFSISLDWTAGFGGTGGAELSGTDWLAHHKRASTPCGIYLGEGTGPMLGPGSRCMGLGCWLIPTSLSRRESMKPNARWVVYSEGCIAKVTKCEYQPDQCFSNCGLLTWELSFFFSRIFHEWAMGTKKEPHQGKTSPQTRLRVPGSHIPG